MGSASESSFSGDLVGNLRSFRAQNRLKKAALQMIAQQMSDDSLEDLRQLFLSLDKKKEGSLKIRQVEEAIRSSGVRIESKEELTSLLWEMDRGSGRVDYTHFLAATMDRQRYLQEELFQVLSGEVVAESNFNSSLNKAGVCDLDAI